MIELNIPRYKSFKLWNDFQRECWAGCDICGFLKGNPWNNPHIDCNGRQLLILLFLVGYY